MKNAEVQGTSGWDSMDPEKVAEELNDPLLTSEKALKAYEALADKYDFVCHSLGERFGPILATELVTRTVKDKDARILDLATGTGIVGEMLQKNGYTNMDALDASEAMLEQAKRKNAYKNYICAFVGRKRLPIKDDTYDAVVTCGSFLPGHINHESFEELIRIIKPGGYICIAMREAHLTSSPFFEGFDETVEKHKENGSWEIVERIQPGPYYQYQYPSALFIFKVLHTKA